MMEMRRRMNMVDNLEVEKTTGGQLGRHCISYCEIYEKTAMYSGPWFQETSI